MKAALPSDLVKALLAGKIRLDSDEGLPGGNRVGERMVQPPLAHRSHAYRGGDGRLSPGGYPPQWVGAVVAESLMRGASRIESRRAPRPLAEHKANVRRRHQRPRYARRVSLSASNRLS